jgi:hypothetical protein
MDERLTADLMRIAAAGGGFRISAVRGVNDLLKIAAAASHSQHGARIIVTGADILSTEDLIQIATAGHGAVSFE